MRLLELNQAKAALPDHVANFEEVQLCISKILDLYTLALSGIKTADEKAHKEYRRQLTDQSDFIETLKTEIATKDMLLASAEASKIADEDPPDRAATDRCTARSRDQPGAVIGATASRPRQRAFLPGTRL